MTYVGNVVHAHLLAGAALAVGSAARPRVNGQCYFVTNCEPVSFWHFWGIVRCARSCARCVWWRLSEVHSCVLACLFVCWCFVEFGCHGRAPIMPCGAPDPRCAQVHRAVVPRAVPRGPGFRARGRRRRGPAPPRGPRQRRSDVHAAASGARGHHTLLQLAEGARCGRGAVAVRRLQRPVPERRRRSVQARRDLGYAPVWTVHQGISVTARSFDGLRNENAVRVCVCVCVGGGGVAGALACACGCV